MRAAGWAMMLALVASTASAETPDAPGAPAPAAKPTPPAGGAEAQAKTPASPRIPPSSERFVFVPSGIDRTIGFISQLHPDCTSLGTTDSRIEVKPEHGTLTTQTGENFSSYPMGSPMQHCNDQKSPGIVTHYTSAENFVGEDHAEVLYLLPSATALTVRYTIIVK